MARSRFASSLLFTAILVSAVPCAWAQMTAVTNSTSTPIEGAGHDYIKMLSETVDPANGSLSVRIQAPVPPGRGFTLPFSFAYDSNGIHFPINGVVQGQSAWGTVLHNNTPPIVTTLGGWTYSVPMLSYASLQYKQPGPLNCVYHATAGFVFQDATGARHSLPLAHADTPAPNCSPYYSEQDSGGMIITRLNSLVEQFPSSST